MISVFQSLSFCFLQLAGLFCFYHSKLQTVLGFKNFQAVLWLWVYFQVWLSTFYTRDWSSLDCSPLWAQSLSDALRILLPLIQTLSSKALDLESRHLAWISKFWYSLLFSAFQDNRIQKFLLLLFLDLFCFLQKQGQGLLF